MALSSTKKNFEIELEELRSKQLKMKNDKE